MTNILNIWGSGQILAFSGIDGETDFYDGIVMRTAFHNKTGFDIRLPEGGGSIRFAQDAIESGNFILSGDFFVCPKLKAVFLDTHHILLEG